MNSKLRVDYVSIEGCPGRLGITLCPGKKQQNARSGTWKRDLDEDLMTLKQSHPNIATIIPLVEPHMLVNLQVPYLIEEYENNGYNVEHLWFDDGTAPTQEWMDIWMTKYAAIRQTLLNGEDVLVHCMGGLGRAGTVAALILMSFYYESTEAIQMVRTSRSPEAINLFQQRFLLSLIPEEFK
jgi:ADP-ribosyl-[dinitrogen reductase] hydrolase